MTALALPYAASRQLNWPRVTAWSGTLSLHALMIALLLTPPVATKILQPLRETPTYVDLFREPPPPPPIPVDPTPPKLHPIQQPIKRQTVVPTPPVIPTAPPSEMQYSVPQVQPAQPQADIGPAETAPTALAYSKRTRIAYPIQARRNHEQGTVKLRVLVGADGSAQTVEIEHSSGSRSLDAAARDAVSHWTFQPGTRNGVAYAAWASISIAFDLAEFER